MQGMGRPCKLKRRCRATPGAREGEKRPRPRARRRGSFAPRRMTGVALPGEHYPRKDSVGGEEEESFLEEEEEEESYKEEECLFKANAVNEEDPERDRATPA